MTRKYSHILFDIDGVILDSVDFYVQLFREIAESLGASQTIRDVFYREHVGQRIDTWMNHLVPIENHSRMLPLFHEKNEDRYTLESFSLVPGTKEKLKELRQIVKSISLVSTKRRKGVDSMISHFQLSNLIDFSISGDEVANIKPDPEGINRAIEYFKSDPDQFLFVGDSLHDLGAARNAKVAFLGVTTGVCSAAEWKANDASYVESIVDLIL